MVAMESVDSVANYRTIFLVDASAAFRATFCGRRFEIELPPKKSQLAHLHPHLQGHSSGGGPASFSPFIAKSLYSCAVEALFEYCRIVWDLFPNGERAIKVSACLSDYVRPLNSWEVGQQNYLALHDAFGRLSSTLRLQQAAAGGSAGLQHQSSVENDLGLAYLTNGFAAELDSLSTANFDLTGAAATTTNSARIIIVTALPKNAAVVKALQEKIRTIVEEHGQMSQESRARIKALDVIVINTVPCQEEVSGHESPPLRPSKNLRGCPFFTEDLPTVHLSANLSFTVYSTFSSSFLSSKLTNMAFEHFDLASSTISGIPMKEEQNAGSSANYDVEIVHSKRVHTQFFDSCVYAPIASDLSGFFSTCSREGHQYQTLILKWCTPKSSFSEMNNIMGSYRLTAVDVNSRPSSCLINFLHTGKTVNLEMTGRQTATKSSSSTHPKLTSHSLQSLNGELYINVLNCTRSPIEEPPSISEGVGGRVTDYRVNELAELMRAHRLVRVEPPAKTGAGHHEGLTTVAPPAVDRFRASRLALQRATLYWPLSFGFTVFFNIRDAGYANFYSLLSRDRLSGAAEVAELRNLLFGLAGSEAKGVNLPINAAILRTSSAAASGSGKSATSLKREDHYRILWLEMEHILRCYCRLAENGNGGGGGSGGIIAANPAHQEIFSLFESVKPHSGASFDASHLRLLLPPSGNGTGNAPGVDRAKTPPPSLFSAQTTANQGKPENGNEALVNEAKGVGSAAAAADQKTRPKSLFDPGHVVPSASSIHEMFVARMETKNSSRRREFIGRLTADGAKKVKLYKEMLPQPGAANANATAGDDLQQQQQQQKSAVHSN